jgi:two-component system, cell cycle sensor histidine kinase and response regulator CckA
MKILIAEDNQFYRRMLSATLTEWGYEVACAADGEEAWEILQAKDGPRLGILDWMMPRLDGPELCRRVRKASLSPPRYLILLTAKGGRDNISIGLDSGADDFISKPFERTELHARLRAGLRIVGLQERLASRVDVLENALSEAQKMEPVGRLAGGVAHDFNNLLQIIGGSVALLTAEAEVPPAAREYAQMIKGAADRGAALIRQLLAFSRKQLLQPEILSLNAVVIGAEQLLRRLIGEDIELTTRLGAADRLIQADRGQLEQVIMNLVVNARDAMAYGGSIVLETRQVDVSAERAASLLSYRPGSYVCLSVTDTGCGIDAETRSHIFEPFFTTKGPGKGTGLGLATVYGIVRQSAGFIEVDSTPGQGTTFRIYLPETRQTAEASKTSEVLPAPAVPARGETVLLVEDDDQVRTMLRLTLEANCYRVLEARDGAEALRVFERAREQIDLLLTDIVMPHLSGNQVAERLTQARPGLKVVFMSGYTDDSSLRERVVQTGRPFLQKPFSPLTLQNRLREVLNAG